MKGSTIDHNELRTLKKKFDVWDEKETWISNRKKLQMWIKPEIRKLTQIEIKNKASEDEFKEQLEKIIDKISNKEDGIANIIKIKLGFRGGKKKYTRNDWRRLLEIINSGFKDNQTDFQKKLIKFSKNPTYGYGRTAVLSPILSLLKPTEYCIINYPVSNTIKKIQKEIIPGGKFKKITRWEGYVENCKKVAKLSDNIGFGKDLGEFDSFCWWYINKSEDVELSIWIDNVMRLIKDKSQIIFYGPPGTGKTYKAREFAVKFLGGKVKDV